MCVDCREGSGADVDVNKEGSSTVDGTRVQEKGREDICMMGNNWQKLFTKNMAMKMKKNIYINWMDQRRKNVMGLVSCKFMCLCMYKYLFFFFWYVEG